jgi:hypothetical protein
MKKMLYKTATLFLPISIIIFSIILVLPPQSNSYNISIIDKHKRLTEYESSRIILAGGSNLAFGIDSKAIQDIIRIPVINMGIHAGFGLARILDDLTPFLRSDDILVIVPEYEFFSSGWNGDANAFDLISSTRQYRIIRHPPFYTLPSNWNNIYIEKKITNLIPRKPNPLAYSRYGFNEYGDYIKHLIQKNQPLEVAQSGKPMEINRKYLEQFFLLIDTFTDRGITILISYPGYMDVLFSSSFDAIHELDTAFRSYNGITVISSPDDYAFSREYFYDTVYHLNAIGRELRTQQLIDDLKQYLEADLEASGILNKQNLGQ